MTSTKSNADKAKEILNGETQCDKMGILSLVEDLKAQGKFSYAAMLIKKMLDVEPTNNDLLLDLSLCIYKDTDLPASIKYDKALDFLNKVDEKGNGKIACVKFAQYGAIYKRMWQAEGNFQFLDIALSNYKKGYDLWIKAIQSVGVPGAKIEDNTHASNDNGYNAVNYAFCLDLLAMVKSNRKMFDFVDNQSVDQLKKTANDIRASIIKYYLGDIGTVFSVDKIETAKSKWHSLLKADEWIFCTLGEALFGIGYYDASQYFYLLFKERMTKKGIVQNTEVRNEWKVSVSAQQLYNLSSIQIYQRTQEQSISGIVQNTLAEKQKEVLKVLIPNPNNLGDLAISEKVGLGLSGGGFRAALYHIGVLARLAELDMLRHIEVISCVSGGSIIGAFYYLKVKNLLESKPDLEIEREDYIQLVKEIEVEFLAKVQKNLRQEVFTNIFANMKMAINKHYSRTHRLGELYEEHFYAPLIKEKKAPVYINTLKIYPAERDAQGNLYTFSNFSIKRDNWFRKNKIPNLVLNATCLNTGHNWQFTASWMGEPPANLQPEIDMKTRLRRMYYSDAPDAYKNFRLGYAVASSSCVPGLFAAFPMPDLYKNIDLKLVDGGVHDNQGISSLIEQECKFMIISDASGQLPENNSILNAGPLYTLGRTNNILQERVRENEFMEIATRYRSSQLNDLKFMHLRKQLYPNPIGWINCKEPIHFLNEGIHLEQENMTTPYQINAKVQDLISKIRTDLDAFSDQEAFALMYSGYQMTKYEFLQGKSQMADVPAESWRFFSVAEEMLSPVRDGKFQEILTLGSELFGKVLAISNFVKILSYLFASNFIIAAVAIFYNKQQPSLQMFGLEILGTSIILLLLFSKSVKKYFNLPQYIERLILLLFGIFVIGPLINFYMLCFNRIYLRYGKVVKKWWTK